MTRPRWFRWPQRRSNMSDAEKVIRQQRWRYRAETARTMALPVLVAVIIPTVVGLLLYVIEIGQATQELTEERISVAKDIREQNDTIAENTADLKTALDRLNQLLAFTQRLDSPEAKAEQEAQFSAAIARLNCETREVVQEVIYGFESVGLIEPGQIVVTCPTGVRGPSTGTTTTAPPG